MPGVCASAAPEKKSVRSAARTSFIVCKQQGSLQRRAGPDACGRQHVDFYRSFSAVICASQSGARSLRSAPKFTVEEKKMNAVSRTLALIPDRVARTQT